MIRSITPHDVRAVLALAEATGLFDANDLKMLGTLLANTFDGDKASEAFWLTDDDRGLVGVAYCEPERMTDQTWNLQLIAIHPNRQGQGRGTALLHQVEKTLVDRGGRMLVVETAGTPEFDRTRQFYRKCGYEEEGRIRDFYTTGYDKVAFRKLLQPA
ncbi:GNAT family N-acetyltransferase [Nodosilinea sp. LEGE 06152]|uniref:GNAT family N-acetyltransferase n=1 Tax=Nodosilinea sp. LEGE 06152 TaxID=2777966 RepID=UPI00187E1EE8|nr:GNAT family N-acetyltransferase [Nodosilinea sp. LEGE 06152]MBE9157860.1 GNAT family N-acetyltransferase [Nodosilinea sp. LEGE 06152]